jgi:hypothetical protein
MSGVIGKLTRAPIQWISYALGGLALAVSAAFGGFAPVEHPEPVLKVGEVNAGTPWNVKIVSVRLVQDLEPAVRLEDKQNHWLAVVAEIEITDVESHSDIRDIIMLPTAEGLVFDEYMKTTKDQRAREVLITSDATRVDALHPGLTERVAFLWEQKGDVLPKQVEVQIMGKTWRENTLSGTMEWLDLAPRATLTAPVEDKRNG